MPATPKNSPSDVIERLEKIQVTLDRIEARQIEVRQEIKEEIKEVAAPPADSGFGSHYEKGSL